MIERVLKAIRQEKGFAYVAGANTLAAIAGGLFWLIIASLISVSEYGQINYLISIATISSGVGILGMDTTIMAFFSKKSPRLLLQSNSLVLIASASVSLVVIIFTGSIAIGLLIPSMSFYYMSTTELISKRNHKEFAAIVLGSKITQIILSIVLFTLFGITGFLLGYAISYFLFGYRFLISLKHFQFKFDETMHLWRFSAKVFGSNTVNTLIQQLDKAFIASFFGYQFLGHYQLAFQIFLFSSIIPTTLFRYLLPHESAGILKARTKMIGIMISSFIAIVVIIFAPIAIPMFYPKYLDSIPLIQLLGLCVIPLTLTNILNARIFSENKRTHHVFFSGLITLGSEIILLIVLGTYYGLTGSGIALLTATTSQFVYLFVINKRQVI